MAGGLVVVIGGPAANGYPFALAVTSAFLQPSRPSRRFGARLSLLEEEAGLSRSGSMALSGLYPFLGRAFLTTILFFLVR